MYTRMPQCGLSIFTGLAQKRRGDAQRFSRVVHPSSSFTQVPSPDSLILDEWELSGSEKCIFLYDAHMSSIQGFFQGGGGDPSGGTGLSFSLNVSDFVVGWSWYICIRISLYAASLLSRDWLENGEKMRSSSASVYALQTAINWAGGIIRYSERLYWNRHVRDHFVAH